MRDYDTDHADQWLVREYPRSRLATIDVGKLGRRRHHIAGLIEADVTMAMRTLESLPHGSVGFTAWVVKVVADSVAEEPTIQALNQGHRKQIVFKDVDVALPVARQVEGMEVPLVGLVRQANTKSVQQVHADIQGMKHQEVASGKDYVLGKKGAFNLLHALYLRLPGALRVAAMEALMANPFVRKSKMGTVMVTSLGERGMPAGWIIPKTIHNLSIAVGSVRWQPWVAEGKVEPRQVLRLTVLFDHDVVDGLPAARFAARLVSKLEAGWGLALSSDASGESVS